MTFVKIKWDLRGSAPVDDPPVVPPALEGWGRASWIRVRGPRRDVTVTFKSSLSPLSRDCRCGQVSACSEVTEPDRPGLPLGGV